MQNLAERITFRSFVILFLLSAIACSDGPTDPRTNRPRIEITSAAISDTVTGVPATLTVVVRDSAGNPASNRAIQFDAPPVPPTSVFFVRVRAPGTDSGLLTYSTTTDANGAASVQVVLGVRADTRHIRVSVPSLTLEDSVAVTVRPGAAAMVHVPTTAFTLKVGTSVPFDAFVTDQYGNRRTEAPTVTTTSTLFRLNNNNTSLQALETGMGLIEVHWTRADGDVFSGGARVNIVPPEGRIAVAGRNPVVLIDTDGSNRTTLVNLQYLAIAYSPDYSRLVLSAVAILSDIPGVPDVPGGLAIVTTPGTEPQPIPLPADILGPTWPSWSPDGSTIYFSAIGTDNRSHLYRVRPDGTQFARVDNFDFQVFQPSLSPDARYVAFTQVGFGGVIYIWDRNTGTVRELIRGNEARAPRWSPDGQLIAFQEAGCDLRVLRIDGTGLRTLGDDCMQPGFSWSPDSRYIAGNTGGPEQLAIVKVESGHLMRLPSFANNAQLTYGQYTAWRPN
jgi:hypothetical protein